MLLISETVKGRAKRIKLSKYNFLENLKFVIAEMVSALYLIILMFIDISLKNL